ncbi:MAG: 4-hydroxythreonine-4-phosphate dehydrogenase [Gammaproteobacteria bacterium]|jgi:4-hydroxythreonine-4-phosphate dehydrogenase
MMNLMTNQETLMVSSTSSQIKPCIAITSGEPAGIGPEIIAQIKTHNFDARLVIIGDQTLIKQRAEQIGFTQQTIDYNSSQSNTDADLLEILHVPLGTPCKAGELNTLNANYVLKTLERACKGCLSGEFDAMVTAPVQKDIINQAGIPFSGHTEYLANICGVKKPVMMLATDNLRVALTTIHMPLRAVPDTITAALIIEISEIVDHDLRTRFGLDNPHIKICGLNPHAGENGYLGHEEIESIIPAIKTLQSRGMNVSGPYPADTVFTPAALADADVVLAMYHDQGLPVLKHAGFHNAINTTLGLPIIRSSVDHGTALDLAGSDKANPNSLIAAINSALFQINCSKLTAAD